MSSTERGISIPLDLQSNETKKTSSLGVYDKKWYHEIKSQYNLINPFW